MIALDLPGHGSSAKPDAPYTIDFFAGMVRSLARELGVDEAVVAGSSLGGRVALELAAWYPSFTRALVLAAPASDTRRRCDRSAAPCRRSPDPRVLRASLDEVVPAELPRPAPDRSRHAPPHPGGALARGRLPGVRARRGAIARRRAGGRSAAARARDPARPGGVGPRRTVSCRSRAAQRLLRHIPHARLHVLEQLRAPSHAGAARGLQPCRERVPARRARGAASARRSRVMFTIDKPLPAHHGGRRALLGRLPRGSARRPALRRLRSPALPAGGSLSPMPRRGARVDAAFGARDDLLVHRRPPASASRRSSPTRPTTWRSSSWRKASGCTRNVIECPNDELRIGMPVEVVFEKIDDEVTLPRFRPRRSGQRRP